MPVITQMFPYIVPPEIQVELDKQDNYFKGICNWIKEMKQSLISGKNTDQVFITPKTPAYRRRKRSRKIKPIAEEACSDTDNTFDISSSSMQSSFSSVSSEVSIKRSRRTAAVKADVHIKANLTTNLGAKLRQPTPEPECDQSGIVTHSSESSAASDNPPCKKICLDHDSTVESSKIVCGKPGKLTEVTVSESTCVAASDSDDDILLSEICTKKESKSVRNMLNAEAIQTVPTPGTRQVSPDSCKLEVTYVSELGPNLHAARNTVSTQSTRGRPITQKQRRKEENLQLKDSLKQPNSLANKLDFNSHADDVVEETLCVDTGVKNQIVSMIPYQFSMLSNDLKLKMRAVVSISKISLSKNAVNCAVSMPKEDTVADSALKVSDKEKKVLLGSNDTVTAKLPATDLNVTVTKQSAVENEKEDGDIQRDVIEKPSTAFVGQDADNADLEKLDQTFTEQNVATPQEVAADSKQVSPGEIVRQSKNSLSKITDSSMKPEIDTLANSPTSHQGGEVNLTETKVVASIKNLEKINYTASPKTGNECRSVRKNLDYTKNNTQSPNRSGLDGTFICSPGKTLSPSVALADISNTMNTSTSLRDNILKDLRKTPKHFDSSHYASSTPWFNDLDGSSSVNSSLNWNCKVILSNSKQGGASDKLLKTPCRSPVVFSPYAKESVKNRVAKFENLNTLVEVTDENSEPPVHPQSVRVTRTKTRAMAAAAAAAAAASHTESDVSPCDSSRKNNNAVQTSARKSLKRALRRSQSKLKKGFLTPNTSRDENKLYSMLTSSMKKYNNVVIGMDTFLPRVNKQSTQELEMKKKEEEQKRQKERAEEACRKREIMLNAKAMEKKKRNDEKIQKVLEKRDAQQREEQERRLRLEREKEEKMLRMMQTRDEKLREEQLLKRQQLQQKLLEVEERRRQEDAVRLARIREQEEQEARKKEQLEKERVAGEKAAAREQALLKQIANNTFTCQPGSSKSNKQDAVAMDQTYNLEDEVSSYKISDVGANSDDDLTIKHTVPKWAKSYQKSAHCFSEFMAHTYIPEEMLHQMLGGNDDPDLTSLLGLTSEQVAHCRRKSSMFPARK